MVEIQSGRQMNFSNASDPSLLALHASVQRQVEAERHAAVRHSVLGKNAKKYADELREEMDRRQLRFTPIDWHR
jgi:hypothetical protein